MVDSEGRQTVTGETLENIYTSARTNRRSKTTNFSLRVIHDSKKNMKGVAAAGVLIVSLVHVDGFARYATLIPNGNQVTNPCAGGGFWAAVGHSALAGGGPRNVFGTVRRTSNFTTTRSPV